MNLYDVMRNLISITADVVCLDSSYNLLFKHSRGCMVNDDVPETYWTRNVRAVGLHDDYPNEIVIWVED